MRQLNIPGAYGGPVPPLAEWPPEVYRRTTPPLDDDPEEEDSHGRTGPSCR